MENVFTSNIKRIKNTASKQKAGFEAEKSKAESDR